MLDAHLFARSRAYVETTATPREALPAVTGVSQAVLDAIADEGAMPAPTYTIFDNAIVSPIATLGSPHEGEVGREYFCPSVLGWLKHAALLQQSKQATAPALEAAFADSFRSALRRQVGAACLYAWRRLFRPNGELNDTAVDEEVRNLSADWMNGGWAVCLRKWDGHHVVTKDLERARIAFITEDGKRKTLRRADQHTLRDAIARLDAVILPFAPHERPHGTPGLFIDRMRDRYGV
jgi:hypothetical protein